MCQMCEWLDAANRALAVADALPAWKTNSASFYLDMAATIQAKQHVTPRQLEVIEEGESEVSED
jgi:hypothetical protein